MSRVQVQSYVRSGSGFLSVGEVRDYDGDCLYVPGAISLVIDGRDVLGLDLWDDVNWLWPFVVQALAECRQSGSGKRGFPDQPISFKVEDAWAGSLRVTVTDGESINRSAVAPADELYAEVARAGIKFFDELRRLCPGSEDGAEEREVLASWL